MSSDLHYHLPKELIAEKPVENRETSRLMVLNRKTKDISHYRFFEVEKFLQEGDCLVLNNTRVIKARLFGQTDSGKKVEVLLVEKQQDGSWLAMLKRSRKFKDGARVMFGNYVAEIGKREEEYRNLVFEPELTYEGVDSIGYMPIPPYIVKTRRNANV